jgi:hypothetical protein
MNLLPGSQFYPEYDGFKYFRKIGVACLSTGVNGSLTQNFATFSKFQNPNFHNFYFDICHLSLLYHLKVFLTAIYFDKLQNMTQVYENSVVRNH